MDFNTILYLALAALAKLTVGFDNVEKKALKVG